MFGPDVNKALAVFNRQGYQGYQRNREHRYLEFHVDQIKTLSELDIKIGISTSTLEMRQNEWVVRELKVDLTRPQLFDADQDL